jgi:hypothetical protein
MILLVVRLRLAEYSCLPTLVDGRGQGRLEVNGVDNDLKTDQMSTFGDRRETISMDRNWFVINIAAIGCRRQLPVRDWSTENKMTDELLQRDLVKRSRRTDIRVVVDIDGLLVRRDNENVICAWIDHHRRSEDESRHCVYLRSRKVRTSTSS